jgi:hypothetical protein
VFSQCLSRAWLGKTITFSIEMAQKMHFFTFGPVGEERQDLP